MSELSLQGKIYVICQLIYFIIILYGIVLMKKTLRRIEQQDELNKELYSLFHSELESRYAEETQASDDSYKKIH